MLSRIVNENAIRANVTPLCFGDLVEDTEFSNLETGGFTSDNPSPDPDAIPQWKSIAKGTGIFMGVAVIISIDTVDGLVQFASPPRKKVDIVLNRIAKVAWNPIAEAVNTEAAAILAAEAEYRGIPMIHFSTNYVFGRQKQTIPYREDDQPNPVSVYGWTKLEGERRIRDIVQKHWIFRLSSLYGTRRKNFFTMMLGCNLKGIEKNDKVIDRRIRVHVVKMNEFSQRSVLRVL